MAPSELTHQAVAVNGGMLHIVQAGMEHSESVVFVHGWPEDWTEWQGIIPMASQRYRVVALDLPGVGGSRGTQSHGDKAEIAATIHQAIQSLGLHHYTIVGHDAGAMVSYAYLRQFAAELRACVLISSVIPGVEPWSKVLANPYIWHFAFHSTPELPEMLVMGKQRPYFDHFFDILTKNPAAIDAAARERYAAAYASPDALRAGFDWYRAFRKDAERNAQLVTRIDTPVLYLRSEHESGTMDDYLSGFSAVGLTSVRPGRIPGSGHFTPDENPAAVWAEIANFIGDQP